MSSGRFRLRTLMIVVAVAALVLAVERTTRDWEPGERVLLLAVSGFLAVLAVPCLADLLSPGSRLWTGSRPTRNPQAETLLELCGDVPDRPARATRAGPPAPEHLEFLVVWARNCGFAAAVGLWLTTMIEPAVDGPEHASEAEAVERFFVVSAGLCAACAGALIVVWDWQYRRYLRRMSAPTRPTGRRRWPDC